MFDVAVLGLGPAGRALVDRCADQGLTVLAVDPAPRAPWERTLCLWSDQLPSWLPDSVLATTISGPALRARGDHRIGREYAVLDTAALQRALPIDRPGVTVEVGSVDDPAALLTRAHRVVDCRGGVTGPLPDRHPVQTAYGIVIADEDAAPALGGAPALFMDWSDDHDDSADLGPTFLYAVPLGGGRTLLEETCLAGAPAPEPSRLARRLHSRLLSRGVSAESVDHPLAVEQVLIPLLPGRRGLAPGIEAFGAAAGYGHCATGYSVAASLTAAPAVARALATGTALPGVRPEGTTRLHRRGLAAILHSDPRTVIDLFEAFATADSTRQRAFLDPTRPARHVLDAMTTMGLSMPLRSRARLAAAAARPLPGSG